MLTFEWAIEDILEAHPDLYVDHCAAMAVALMSRHAASPCEFIVQWEGFSVPALEGEKSFVLRVRWNDETALVAARVWLTEQRKAIVERAGVALAALLFAHLIPAGEMRVSGQGQRVDYWLPRLGCGLEISGTERSQLFSRRRREKIAQVLGNPWGQDGYVFICCFNSAHRLIDWSYHRQPRSI
jgi:hypothetical protein